MQIKIPGLGHTMRGDDEVDLKIVRRWKEEHGADFPAEQIEVSHLEAPV